IRDGHVTGVQTCALPIWLPFLDDDAGNYLALDTATAGRPIRDFHLGNAEHAVVASSLTAWLDDFVTQVEQGRYEEEPERGTFLRSEEHTSELQSRGHLVC